jgi:predicted secreted Zn-dependent protease
VTGSAGFCIELNAARGGGEKVKKTIAIVLLLSSLPPHGALAQDVQATEKVESYAISGSSGIELYRSIGERGPESRNGRAIALTDYRLTWTRKYVPEGGGCRLTTAVPHLTLITHLPKPAGKLPERTGALWNTFIVGITAHERVHGETIRETVTAIRAATEDLAVPGDAACRKIRVEVTKRVAALAAEMRRKNRHFDEVEMGKGGNVQQLILALVNGDRD